jgi:hypothetical protein
MKPLALSLFVSTTLFLGACASNQSGPSSPQATTSSAPAAAPAKDAPKKVKSRDGSFEGEVIGTAASGSKFAKLQIGMQMSEVQELLGNAPDRFHSYESGKRWIPFYFGNDARRMQVLYKGAGCLMFTGGNVWGGGAGDLIGITHDTSGACYQP